MVDLLVNVMGLLIGLIPAILVGYYVYKKTDIPEEYANSDYVKKIKIRMIVSLAIPVTLFLMFALVGFSVGGFLGMIAILAIPVLLFLFSTVKFWSKDLPFPLSKEKAPQLYSLVSDVSKKMGVDKEIEVGLDEGFNAYTYGLGRPKIGIGLPLFDYLSVSELKSIIAHEVGHIKNKDQGFTAFISITLDTFRILSDWSLRLLGFGINFFKTIIVLLTASLVGDTIATLIGWLVEIVVKIFMFIIAAYLWVINKLLELTCLVFVRQREFTADLHTTAFENQNKPQFFKNALGKLSLLSQKEAEFEKEVFEKRAKTAKEKKLKASDIYKKPHIKELYSWLNQKNFKPAEQLIDSEIIQKEHDLFSRLKSWGHTHPITADRIRNLDSLMTQYPPSKESDETENDDVKALTLITDEVYKEAVSTLYENNSDKN